MGFLDKLKEGASKAADKAKETVEITKFSTQISSKKKEMEKCYIKLGEAVFEAFLAENLAAAEGALNEIGSEIIGLRKDIAALEVKIKEARNEKVCECGKIVALDVKFCPSCGHRFDEPVASSDAADAEGNGEHN